MLTEALVTIPAKTNVIPKDRKIGQGVGAGRLTALGVLSRVSVTISALILFSS
jgi:hypothetical protein